MPGKLNLGLNYLEQTCGSRVESDKISIVARSFSIVKNGLEEHDGMHQSSASVSHAVSLGLQTEWQLLTPSKLTRRHEYFNREGSFRTFNPEPDLGLDSLDTISNQYQALQAID